MIFVLICIVKGLRCLGWLMCYGSKGKEDSHSALKLAEGQGPCLPCISTAQHSACLFISITKLIISTFQRIE